ncbi:unnamed protein product [Blepharisma stoltei]|uniref:Rab-GAP TBC domain-containing protein n=1 Tax=Blepharisma stoltei TaxID=1481888 RepID=A0AAU9IBN6_9CILI|nr:unnamed protein product [Blepharisma stoltei]
MEYVDKYGFVSETKPKRSNLSFIKVNSRIEKWQKMLTQWEKYTTSKEKILKNRCRKGIPDVIRGRAWYMMSNTQKVKDYYPKNMYEDIKTSNLRSANMNDINKDLARTFPENVYFRFQGGQEALLNVLRAYSLLDTEVGYCQGMAYLVGVLLMFMDEENAFYLFVNIMYNFDMRGYFLNGMEKTYLSLYITNKLMKLYEPALWEHFNDVGFVSQIYATQWYVTIFTYSFQMETILRIWDCYLYEGPKILYRMSLGFMRFSKNHLKNLGIDLILRKVREIEETIDVEQWFKVSFNISLSRKRIKEIEKEYIEGPDEEFIQWRA